MFGGQKCYENREIQTLRVRGKLTLLLHESVYNLTAKKIRPRSIESESLSNAESRRPSNQSARAKNKGKISIIAITKENVRNYA